MDVTINPKGILQIDNARIIFKNFRGERGKYNNEGDRNFALVISGGIFDDGRRAKEVTAEEMAECLMNDVNRYGVGWNVKIKAPQEEGGQSFIYLPVKVRCNEYGPKIFLKTGDKVNELDEETIGILDKISILSVDLDIRPYDDEVSGKPFRAAYLQSMGVTQEVDRIVSRYAEEEFPFEEE